MPLITVPRTGIPALSSLRTLEQSSTSRGRSVFREGSTSKNNKRLCSTLRVSGNCFTTIGLAPIIFSIRGSKMPPLLLGAGKRFVHSSNLRALKPRVYPVLPVGGIRVYISRKTATKSFAKGAPAQLRHRAPNWPAGLLHICKGLPDSFRTSSTPPFAATVRRKT